MTITSPTTWLDEFVANLLGQSLQGYEIGPLIGRGAFGLVFETLHPATGQAAAIKLLNPSRFSPANILDFQNESLILNQLNGCEGTVSIFARGEFRLPPEVSGFPFEMSLPYQIMPRALKTLDEYSRSPDAIDRTTDLERMYLWRSAVLSLAQTHAFNVAHRDLKSENCLVFAAKNGRPIVRYADFGRGKDLGKSPTRPFDEYLIGRGDPLHAPPEALYLQAGSGRDDFIAADYYGIGSIFVELVTGFPLTQQTVGDFRSAQSQAIYDFDAGRKRDLTVLTSKHDLILKGITQRLPRSVQTDSLQVLKVLCSPDPAKRLGPGPFSRDRRTKEPLLWVLNRVDIMIKRLEIEERTKRRQRKGK